MLVIKIILKHLGLKDWKKRIKDTPSNIAECFYP